MAETICNRLTAFKLDIFQGINFVGHVAKFFIFHSLNFKRFASLLDMQSEWF